MINFLANLYHLLDIIWIHRLLSWLDWWVYIRLVIGFVNEYLSLDGASRANARRSCSCSWFYHGFIYLGF